MSGHGGTGPASSLRRLDAATAPVTAPLAAVDLDALDANARFLVAAAGGLPIRLASKSIRCVELISYVLREHPGFQGVLAFTPDEACHLAYAGIDDILVAYPTADGAAVERVVETAERTGARIRLLVDSPEHVRFLAAHALGRTVPVCAEIDLGWWPLGGRLAKIGPKRSPVRTPQQAAELAALACRTKGVELTSVLAYEGHIAGVGDIVPGRPLRQLAVRGMQAASLREIARRLPLVLSAIEATLAEHGAAPLELVNGGGSGSLQRTSGVGAATELSAGSGLFDPLLFDRYRSLRLEPAVAYAMPVVRKPLPTVATLLGGGYIASGVPGPDRAPVPALPEGLAFDGDEGAGEVQTPLHGAGALGFGDRVWLRHAKSGELLERFNEIHFVRDAEVLEVVRTYRGEGHCFL
ncbi:alanine racemase [Tomitella fengzijianii]|uniref:Amino acid deaminase/aldolase n=1 Tax=Tomitella fengzijianii TaxID=2597660 RepID=A0A516WZR7_9ACTN|nr:alanine racemase [Tomitella fengzijianii]QDQ96298.1 amino acid deaminase/aldolase [Tomitella fengzijianii]